MHQNMLQEYNTALTEVSENIKLQFYIENHYLNCKLISHLSERKENQNEFRNQGRNILHTIVFTNQVVHETCQQTSTSSLIFIISI